MDNRKGILEPMIEQKVNFICIATQKSRITGTGDFINKIDRKLKKPYLKAKGRT